ncbi:ketopantoate reductase family protein [Tepidamorphus sp. 3E244]|uniref:ketopantoate reductase family protein n=1 Tax=Tepidamorphus sp. 3E244 TaxID=3385498 RepID=UPI0038FC68EC
MAYNVLILGASYGSLLGTKLLMAGHHVTLVCRTQTAELINSKGTEVRIKLRGEDDFRAIRSGDLPGKLNAVTPEDANPGDYDMVGLAMSEPQYGASSVATLMKRIAEARVPCLSIMNMPPLAYLRRIEGINCDDLEGCYANPRVWDGFDPELVTLCSPDPQAFRPPECEANVLQVGLPTNFKAAAFACPEHNEMLQAMEDDIAAVTIDGNDVPVKLKKFDSLFVPLAKWSMLITGNYRCMTKDGLRSIKDAVHTNPEKSEGLYHYVDEIARKLGADPEDQVPFEKYANAAKKLLKPSSAARSVDSGATQIERVDCLVQKIGKQLGLANDEAEETIAIVNALLARNSAAEKAA